MTGFPAQNEGCIPVFAIDLDPVFSNTELVGAPINNRQTEAKPRRSAPFPSTLHTRPLIQAHLSELEGQAVELGSIIRTSILHSQYRKAFQALSADELADPT